MTTATFTPAHQGNTLASAPSFKSFAETYQRRVNQALENQLAQTTEPSSNLQAAMTYSLLNGGKRVRPLLVYGSALACGHCTEAADHFAAAIELIHTYSLIHDDLPAMDDDALRRGKATCHIAFNEATAILAGDALQCMAFEVMAKTPHCEPSRVIDAMTVLSQASGPKGMVLGQDLDLNAVNQSLSLASMETMHLKKTGALIEASTVLGAIAAGATAAQRGNLAAFARAIGLAFQIQDDILDVTGDSKTLGKMQGSDASQNKPTYVTLLGLEKAQEKSAALLQTAIEHLNSFGEHATHLQQLAEYIVKRNH